MSANFKSGDVVILRSGGPDMSVSETTGDGLVKVVWMDGETRMETSFRESVLMLKPGGA